MGRPPPGPFEGQPAGYQLDLVDPSAAVGPTALERVAYRATAIARGARSAHSLDEGRARLFERTYEPRHFVFISHDQKLGDRQLVDAIVAACRAKGIRCWEYVACNQSAEDWRRNMKAGLDAMTHMVSLLSPGYEQSEGCCEEWACAMDSSRKVKVLPFLTGGRTRPAVELRDAIVAHEPLSVTQSVDERAATVVARLQLAWKRA